jgi:sugar/nucleoside kinase (ribokinase family)
MKRVLVIGDIAAEVRLSGLSGHPRRGTEVFVSGARVDAGGAGARFAAAATTLGRRVTLAGRVGRDALGRAVRDELAGLVDASRIALDPSRPTGLGMSFSDDEDSSRVTYAGATAAIGTRDLAGLDWSRYTHLHVASPFQVLGDPWVPLLRKARSRKLTVSLGAGADPRGRWDLGGLFPLVHLLLLGESEARALGGGRALAGRVALVVVRRGAKGSVAWTQGREWKSRAPAWGPAFDAAFVDGWLEGHRVGEILEYAGAASTLAAERGGGLGDTPTRAEALHQVGRNLRGRKPR